MNNAEKIKEYLNDETLDALVQNGRPFQELMMRYNCAMLEIKTKLDVLNNEFSLENDRNPFEAINCRIKTPQSIVNKMRRKGIEITVENIEKNLNDVAGIRVICSFIDDIYTHLGQWGHITRHEGAQRLGRVFGGAVGAE